MVKSDSIKERTSTLKGLQCKIESLASLSQRHLCLILKTYDEEGVSPSIAKQQIRARMSGTSPRLVQVAEDLLVVKRLLNIWSGQPVFVPAIITKEASRHAITFPTFKFSVYGMMEVHDLVANILKNERVPKSKQAKLILEDASAHLLKKYSTPESVWLGDKAEWITTFEKDVFASFRSTIVTANENGPQETEIGMIKEPHMAEAAKAYLLRQNRDDSPAFEDCDCELFEPETVRTIQGRLENGVMLANDAPEPAEIMKNAIIDAISSSESWGQWVARQLHAPS